MWSDFRDLKINSVPVVSPCFLYVFLLSACDFSDVKNINISHVSSRSVVCDMLQAGPVTDGSQDTMTESVDEEQQQLPLQAKSLKCDE